MSLGSKDIRTACISVTEQPVAGTLLVGTVPDIEQQPTRLPSPLLAQTCSHKHKARAGRLVISSYVHCCTLRGRLSGSPGTEPPPAAWGSRDVGLDQRQGAEQDRLVKRE